MPKNISAKNTQSTLAAWIILFISLSFTLASWYVAEQTVAKSNYTQFQLHVERLKAAIANRVNSYEQMLRGVSVFAEHNFVTHSTLDLLPDGEPARNEWHIYVNKLQLDTYYRGILAVGFSRWITAQDLEQHIATVRAEGIFPQYTVYPEGNREVYVPIVYLEPLVGHNISVIGYDMYSEPTRRAALQYAKNTGNIGITDKLTLAVADGKNKQAAFIMFLPIYREGIQLTSAVERQDAIIGFVSGAFRMNDFMKGIFGNTQSSVQSNIDFEIYDGTTMNEDTLMYDDSDEDEAHEKVSDEAVLAQTELFKISGHTWTLHFTALSGFKQEVYHQTPPDHIDRRLVDQLVIVWINMVLDIDSTE